MARKTVDKPTLRQCERAFGILKDNETGHSLEDRAAMVRSLEEITKPSYFQLKKNGKRSVKKTVKGFRDKRHFFEYMEEWLDDQRDSLGI